MTRYYCKHCGKTYERDSDKQWIKSYCERSGRDVRLQRCKNEELIAEIAKRYHKTLKRLADA